MGCVTREEENTYCIPESLFDRQSTSLERWAGAGEALLM